ncbi:MAG: hypothetical protein ACUZ8H_01590 [Candidatus Anammoxibacter sp.]
MEAKPTKEELKKQLELLIAYCNHADIESIIDNTFEDEIEDTIEAIKGAIEILEK